MSRICLFWILAAAWLAGGCAAWQPPEERDCKLHEQKDEESGRTYVWCTKKPGCKGECFLLLSANEKPKCHCKESSFKDDPGWRERPNNGGNSNCKMEINRNTPAGGFYVRCSGSCANLRPCRVWYKKPGPGEIEYGCDCP